MRRSTLKFLSLAAVFAFCLPCASSLRAQTKEETTVKVEASKSDPSKSENLKPEQQTTHGSATIGGTVVNYEANAGTIVVHPKGWDDLPQNHEGGKDTSPECAMSYFAYFKSDTKGAPRPITFIYNGGPGSSTVWLHMGAFGPKRVVTLDDSHTPAAPYPFINNEYSLLDASDLVFVDAPGTGFGRLAGKDREKAFFGVDADGQAFADFITQFLGKYSRWNSPKYVFGESYGTTRSAVLANILETEKNVDFNGIILLSQILSFDNSADIPEFNPGMDMPYQLALPTYAATAWYHHKLPSEHKDLEPFLTEVEHFALNEYGQALAQGSALPTDQRKAIIAKLHEYTALPESYLDKANLRISGGEFEKNLQDDQGLTTGRLDSRFSGPTMDPLSKEADYDPQSAAISSAYVSAFNDYVRKELKFGDNRTYRPEYEVFRWWNFQHQAPGVPFPLPIATNVMPDLAIAMKYNPDLKVMLNAGYFDLATPFFEGIYEMQHLQIPAKLQSNIEYKFYQSGHMVYAHEASLKELHDNVAAFIQKTATKSK